MAVAEQFNRYGAPALTAVAADYGRRAVRAEQECYFADTNYVHDARRFDMGERDHFISMEMASIGMEVMAKWGASAVAVRLASLTARLADGLCGADVSVPAARAPHIISVGFRHGMPKELAGRLTAERIYVARRLGRMRISPHVGQVTAGYMSLWVGEHGHARPGCSPLIRKEHFAYQFRWLVRPDSQRRPARLRRERRSTVVSTA